jgi:hypothetical protein
MSPQLSPSALSSLSSLGVSAVSCAFGLQLLASGAGRFARLAMARRVLLSCGWSCWCPQFMLAFCAILLPVSIQCSGLGHRVVSHA